MAVNYNLLDYHLNALVTELMKNKGITYDSAMQKVLSSKTYQKLQVDDWLLEEGPIYIYDLLEQEIN